jgi:hypothetical protein
MKSRTGQIIMIAALIPLLLAALQGEDQAGGITPLYKDPSVPTEDRISDLLRRMSTDEKIAQLQSVLRDVEKETLITGPGLGGIGPADLAFYDRTLSKVIEPGNVEISVGSSSDDIRIRGVLEIIP